MGEVPINYYYIIFLKKCTAFGNGFFEKCEGITQSINQSNKQTNNIAQASIQNIINSLDLSRVYGFKLSI